LSNRVHVRAVKRTKKAAPPITSRSFGQRDPATKPRSEWLEDSAWAARLQQMAFMGMKHAPNMRALKRNVHDGRLAVIVSEEPKGWHLSISHEFPGNRDPIGRYPTWDEIADARYRLLPPDLTFVMRLPPLDEYVAHHPTTFHLHEHPERDVA
jgi:hypothetical protein